MNRLLLIITFLASGLVVQAQEKKNIKTKVLVVGHEEAAVGAAVQAAISGVPAVLLTSETSLEIQPSVILGAMELSAADMKNAKRHPEVPSVEKDKNGKPKKVKVVIPDFSADELKDSIANFSKIMNTGWTKFERSGSGWAVKLNDGRTIKAEVLIYAVKKNLGEKVLYTKSNVYTPLNYADNLYRTSIAGKHLNGKPVFASFYSLTKKGEENVVFANADDADRLVGRAAGAIAAYATFFETKTSLASLKITQGELLKYKSNIIPLSDINTGDTNWQAMQKIAISGVLKADFTKEDALFRPDQPVTINEITQPVKDYYYKAQIWFDDHKNVPVDLDNMIKMVSYVGNKSPENTKQELEKKWKTTYKFTSDFDLKKVLTRKEFSSLMVDYLNPFTVNIEPSGRVQR